jgi:hypothetical protein
LEPSRSSVTSTMVLLATVALPVWGVALEA